MADNLITKHAARLAAYADRVKAERRNPVEAATLEALIRVHQDLCRRHSPYIMAQDYGYLADAIAQATGQPVQHQGQDCELCDGMGGYVITGSTAPAQVCPGCGGSGLAKG